MLLSFTLRSYVLCPVVLPALLSAAACSTGTPAPHSAHPLTSEESLRSSRALLDLTRALGTAPYRATLQVRVTYPVTGKIESGRGAIAVSPHEAMRMVLVGPLGATMLDAWVTTDRWRFEVPPLHSIKRGTFAQHEDAYLPVGFFRWWFLGPADGTLAGFDRVASRYFLEAPSARVEIVVHTLREKEHEAERETAIEATRFSEEGHVERVEWRGPTDGAGPSHAKYIDYATGARVEVSIDPPAALASRCVLRDPDGPPCDEGGAE